MIASEDVVEICQLLAMYGHILDDRDWDSLPLLFTPDAEFDRSSTTVAGYDPVDKGVDKIRDGFERGGHALPHMSTNVWVQPRSGPDAASVRSKFLCLVHDGASEDPAAKKVVTGEYLDDFVKTAHGWRIARRVVIPDGTKDDMMEFTR